MPKKRHDRVNDPLTTEQNEYPDVYHGLDNPITVKAYIVNPIADKPSSTKPGKSNASSTELDKPNPEPAKAGKSNPDPTKAGKSSPDPAKSGNSNPDPAKAIKSNPDPAKGGKSTSEPAKDDNSNPDHAKASISNPDPAKAGKYNPDPAKAGKYNPDPAKEGASKLGITKSSNSNPDPAKAGTSDLGLDNLVHGNIGTARSSRVNSVTVRHSINLNCEQSSNCIVQRNIGNRRGRRQSNQNGDNNRKGACEADPMTTTGKKIQLVQIMGMTAVPIILLACIAGIIFGLRVLEYQKTTNIRRTVEFSIDLANIVHSLQLERDRSATYVTTTDAINKDTLLRQYEHTDEVIVNVARVHNWEIASAPYSYLKSSATFLHHLNEHRYQLDTMNATQHELQFYTDIIGVLVTWFLESIPEIGTGTVWKLIVSLNEIVESKEAFGVERAYGSLYYLNGGFDSRKDYLVFVKAQDVANDSLAASREYSHMVAVVYEETLGAKTTMFTKRLHNMRYQIRLHPSGIDMEADMSLLYSKWWYGNMSLYMEQLLEIQKNITSNIRQVLTTDEKADQMFLGRLGVFMGLILCIGTIVFKVVYGLSIMDQQSLISLEDRATELNNEQTRTDDLLYSMLPPTVAEKLKHNVHVEPELFDEVTVFFSDMVDFTTICSRSSPLEVVNILDTLYTCFDDRVELHDVYKVQTIGDAYMVASGLPNRNGVQHAVEIANMALDIMSSTNKMEIPHMPGVTFKLRIGCHTGSVVAGIAGSRMPRYSIFGETVSIASKMESTGKAGKIQITASTQLILCSVGGFTTKPREDRESEMLTMETHWLTDGPNCSIRDSDEVGGAPPEKGLLNESLYGDLETDVTLM